MVVRYLIIILLTRMVHGTWDSRMDDDDERLCKSGVAGGVKVVWRVV